MSVRWGTGQSATAPALLERAGHSVTALLVAILLLCALGMAVGLQL